MVTASSISMAGAASPPTPIPCCQHLSLKTVFLNPEVLAPVAWPLGPAGDELSSPLGGEAHLSAWAEGPPAKEENLAAESLQSGSRRNCSYPLFVYLFLFIWLPWVLSCGMQPVGSNFLTRDQTQAQCIGSVEC